MREVAKVNAERETTLATAFASLLCAQQHYHAQTGGVLERIVSSAADADETAVWSGMRQSIAQLSQQTQGQAGSRGADDSLAGGGGGDYRPPAPPPPSRPSQPQQHHTSSPLSRPTATPSPPPESTVDLLGGGGSPLGGGGSLRASARTPPPSLPEEDLLGGALLAGSSHSHGSASPPPAGGMDLLGGDVGSSAMDELMNMGAPAALKPTAAAATRGSPLASHGSASSLTDDFDMLMGGRSPQPPPPSRLGSAHPSNANIAGSGMGDLMGGMGGDLMGGMGVPARPAARARAQTMQASIGGGDPFGLGDGADGPPAARHEIRARIEAEKEAAIRKKVDDLKQRESQAEANRDLEQQLQKTIKARVQQWQKEKKNLRSLLASLHEIAPPCSWKPVAISELIDPSKVSKHYKKALLAVHPDKQPSDDVEKKVLAQHVFDALRDAWHIFGQTG